MESVDEILRALARGTGIYDEPEVDVLEHSLQCAERLAASHPGDPELIAAGLVHDIADILVPDAHRSHEHLGAEAIRPVLGDRVAHLVDGHVEAKRYLMGREARNLSQRSLQTMAQQGGPMNHEEMRLFEADTEFASLIALREADDASKVAGRATQPLESWRPLLSAIAVSIERQVDQLPHAGEDMGVRNL